MLYFSILCSNFNFQTKCISKKKKNTFTSIDQINKLFIDLILNLTFESFQYYKKCVQ